MKQMSELSLQDQLREFARRKGLPFEACRFVNDAVAYAVSQLSKRRHVTARELSCAARDFAARKYGVMAHAVLAEYGLLTARDLGRFVYLLIDGGILAASPGDDPADFEMELDLAAPPPEDVKSPRSRLKIDRM